jgi:FKBP-type peptidyl-prolyl cis-trans isomerase FkpA
MDNITALQMTDTKLGSGAEAMAGKQVSVHYTGWLYDGVAADHHGSKFDSSRDRNDPFAFRLGARQVIAGWDQGVAGMKVGGSRTLVIPSTLAYGPSGAGGVIPPNATLCSTSNSSTSNNQRTTQRSQSLQRRQRLSDVDTADNDSFRFAPRSLR